MFSDNSSISTFNSTLSPQKNAKVHPLSLPIHNQGQFPPTSSINIITNVGEPLPGSNLINYAGTNQTILHPSNMDLMNPNDLLHLDPAEVRKMKELHYVNATINDRMFRIGVMEIFEKYSLILLICSIFIALIAITILLYMLRLTILFSHYEGGPELILLLPIIVLFMPISLWLFFYFVPTENQKKRRDLLNFQLIGQKSIINKKSNKQRNDDYFNNLISGAKDFSTIPPRKIKIYVHFRKKILTVSANTWFEFYEDFYSQTGLSCERVLIRYKDEDLIIEDLTKELELDYNIKPSDHVYIYNKGGYYTGTSPIKRQYDDLSVA